MKKILPIILLLSLSAPFAGTFLWLKYQKMITKKEVKRSMIAGIDREKLVRLEFTTEEANSKLEWEHSHEFEFEGRMYDVVETLSEGEKITYWCWLDHEETALNKQLRSLVARIMGNNQQQRENENMFVDFFKHLFSNKTNHHLLTGNLMQKIPIPELTSTYILTQTGPPVPPPEIG
jgi:hypothetical protein